MIPHPEGTYGSKTGKPAEGESVWRVHLAQGLHGHSQPSGRGPPCAPPSRPHSIAESLRQSPRPLRRPCDPFAKRSHRQLDIGYRGAPGSMQLGRINLEVLLHPLRSLPPTLKGCWRSQGLPLGRPLALKPQQQKNASKVRRKYQTFVATFVNGAHLTNGSGPAGYRHFQGPESTFTECLGISNVFASAARARPRLTCRLHFHQVSESPSGPVCSR